MVDEMYNFCIFKHSQDDAEKTDYDQTLDILEVMLLKNTSLNQYLYRYA